MTNTIPAITIWQPWASLVACGAKRFEFRSWAAPSSLWGRRVGVHAGARPVQLIELRELLDKLRGPHWQETGLSREPAIELIEATFAARATIPLSSMLCTATLGRPIRGRELAQTLGTKMPNDSHRDEHSNWGWPLSNVSRLAPVIPARGARGWWQWAVPEGVNA